MTNPTENGHERLDAAETERTETANGLNDGDSTSSELERLDNESPCPSHADSPTERGIAKSKKQEDLVLKLIAEANALGSNTLDLANKGILQIPPELLELPQLEHLYLEGNELSSIPDDFFDRLPNLKWLDLRRNYLVRLPSVYTGRHQNLRNLLLEGNSLRTLPLELGLIKSLNGLNINNNPLDFPPQNIIEKGTNEILKFLREMVHAKSMGKLLNGTRKSSSVRRMQTFHASDDIEETIPELRTLANRPYQSQSASIRVKTGLRRSATFKAHSAKQASGIDDDLPPDIGEEGGGWSSQIQARPERPRSAVRRAATFKAHSAGLPTKWKSKSNTRSARVRVKTAVRRAATFQADSASKYHRQTSVKFQDEQTMVNTDRDIIALMSKDNNPAGPARVKTGLRRSATFKAPSASRSSAANYGVQPNVNHTSITADLDQPGAPPNTTHTSLDVDQQVFMDDEVFEPPAGPARVKTGLRRSATYKANSAHRTSFTNDVPPNTKRSGNTENVGQPTAPPNTTHTSLNVDQEVLMDDEVVERPVRVRTAVRRSDSFKAHSAKLASQQFPDDDSEGLQVPPQSVPQEDLGQSSGEQGVPEEDESSTSSDEWDDDGGDLREQAYRRLRQRTLSTEEALRSSAAAQRRSGAARSDLGGPSHRSAELHRPPSYVVLKEEKSAKIKRAGAMGTVERKKSASTSSVLSWKVNKFPEPPSQDYLDFKMDEERRNAKVKELKEKTDAILQRRKDEEVLKEWRDETKRLKEKKYFDSLRKGTKDFLDAAEHAPFGIDKGHLRMQSNEERIKADVKNAHEKIRRPLSPASRQRIEEEKAARIFELEKRIKQHTTQMHERRKQPKGTPQEEMEAARRELEVAEALHRELMAKRREVEYRFRAFVADSHSNARGKSLKQHQ